jgi:deoxyadenosine/deoxycytidine kinase
MTKIVIDGNIGSGKSTALDSIHNHFNSFKIVLEDLDAWMPYLKQFYSNMEKYSLSFQMKVLEHHMKNRELDRAILERSPLSCIYVFGKHLLNGGQISLLDFQLMESYNNSFGWIPKTIIYINTHPTVCQQRVIERSRDGETIPLDYLTAIDSLYRDLYLIGSTLLTNSENRYIHRKIYGRQTIYIVDGNATKENVTEDIEWLIQNYIK